MTEERQVIDPVAFGELKGRLLGFEEQIDRLEARLSLFETKIDELIGLANQGKGGLWMFRSIWFLTGGALSWLLPKILKLFP